MLRGAREKAKMLTNCLRLGGSGGLWTAVHNEYREHEADDDTLSLLRYTIVTRVPHDQHGLHGFSPLSP